MNKNIDEIRLVLLLISTFSLIMHDYFYRNGFRKIINILLVINVLSTIYFIFIMINEVMNCL